mmetsp:Transcript_29082/g.100273  ORF Transcript_29082/g.100273 Transcript_29082/m.100273 type:complete len:201 (-) Transcript_29082:498-1100(-)
MVARTKVRLAWTLRQVPLRLRSSPGPLTIEYASHECGSKYKPALVTLPSSGSSHEQYAPLAAALKVSGAVSKVISINFFGSKGSTPWPQLARPLTLDDLADLVKAVVDDQKLEDSYDDTVLREIGHRICSTTTCWATPLAARWRSVTVRRTPKTSSPSCSSSLSTSTPSASTASAARAASTRKRFGRRALLRRCRSCRTG